MINLIVATDLNGLIGDHGKIPWGNEMPVDMAYFRKYTVGQTVVMGRKTYESIGKKLSGRKNVILTRDEDFKLKGCTVYHRIEDVLVNETTFWVIGGAEIYQAFMPYADKLYITTIYSTFQGDTYFNFNPYDWYHETTRYIEHDALNKYDCRFDIYNKIKDNIWPRIGQYS